MSKPEALEPWRSTPENDVGRFVGGEAAAAKLAHRSKNFKAAVHGSLHVLITHSISNHRRRQHVSSTGPYHLCRVEKGECREGYVLTDT